jgi:uncharacterized protein (TIGR03118 family)
MKLSTLCTSSLYTSALLLVASGSLFASPFSQTNLVSDIPGMALVTDSNMVDPWGMSFSATSPIWVNDRGAGVATVYTGTGGVIPLVVTVPPGAPLGPTGQVFAGGTNFDLSGKPAAFIFDTLGGTIDAWNGGTSATVVAPSTTPAARYEGLALANNTLYAANFESGGAINVFNSSYAETGSFTDSSIPSGYAPFNVQNVNGLLYVEYAKITPNVAVPLPGGGGYVDVYNANGTFVQRLISNGPLDAPWGVALAPAGFGSFGGDLLVGNFGNGEINAFNPTTGAFEGTLTDQNGNPIVNSGLWAINFGNGSFGAKTDALYFDAGLNKGADGLFGDIQSVPEPASFSLAALGILGLLGYAWQRRSNLT